MSKVAMDPQNSLVAYAIAAPFPDWLVGVHRVESAAVNQAQSVEDVLYIHERDTVVIAKRVVTPGSTLLKQATADQARDRFFNLRSPDGEVIFYYDRGSSVRVFGPFKLTHIYASIRAEPSGPEPAYSYVEAPTIETDYKNRCRQLADRLRGKP